MDQRPRRTYTKVHIRRECILESGFEALHRADSHVLKGRLFISFVDKFGSEEAGQDGGGLLREFLEEVNFLSLVLQHHNLDSMLLIPK